MDILEQYQKLRNSYSQLNDGFLSLSLGEDSIFKLAVDNELNPTILISEEKFSSVGFAKPNFRLDKLELKFNVPCNIRDVGTGIELNAPFTIIKQINGNSRMHEYFLRIIDGVVSELRKDLTLNRLNSEIEYLVKLFSSSRKIDENSIKGLWGELLFILTNEDIEHAIKAWHIDRDNLFDFSFNDQSIEVKTTTNNSRSHYFNNDQIRKYKKLKVTVVSIITEKASLGKSVLDLWNDINSKDISDEAINKVSRMISEIISHDIYALSQLKFNFNLGISTIKSITSDEIPNIESNNIPPGITEVRVKINLEAL